MEVAKVFAPARASKGDQFDHKRKISAIHSHSSGHGGGGGQGQGRGSHTNSVDVPNPFHTCEPKEWGKRWGA